METPENYVKKLEKNLVRKTNLMGMWFCIILFTFISILLYSTITDKWLNIMRVRNKKDLQTIEIFLVFACLIFLTGIIRFVFLLFKKRKDQT